MQERRISIANELDVFLALTHRYIPVRSDGICFTLRHFRPIFQLPWKLIYYDNICTLVIDEVSKAIHARVRQKSIAITKYHIF